jgi:hypothetical protein
MHYIEDEMTMIGKYIRMPIPDSINDEELERLVKKINDEYEIAEIDYYRRSGYVEKVGLLQ